MKNEVKYLSYRIVRDFIKKESPKEAPFYDQIWNAFLQVPKPKRNERKKVKERLLTFLDPETVIGLVTPAAISIVTGILSNFFYDLLKKKKKEISKSTKRKVEEEAIRIAMTWRSDKDLARKLVAFTFEYLEHRERNLVSSKK